MRHRRGRAGAGLGRMAHAAAAESVAFIGGHPEHSNMWIRPLHARYPFFVAAREAVESADVVITTLVAEDAPVVERDAERVERTLMEGIAESDPGKTYPRKTKTELLSCLISRTTVSFVGTPATVDKYARAEADTSHERMLADFSAGGNNVHDETRASLDDFLRGFDFDDAMQAKSDRNRDSRYAPDSYWVDVGPYLTYSDVDWSVDWRPVNHSLADDTICVTREEPSGLLHEAVRRRVTEGLPFAVCGSGMGDRLADAFKPHIERPRNLLSDCGAVNAVYVDATDPDHFPPCIKTLLARAREDESLPNEAAFTLVVFLAGVGLDSDEVGGVIGDETAEAL